MERVGIDIGGTFTDLVAADAAGAGFVHKLASTPATPEQAAIAGIADLLTWPAPRPATSSRLGRDLDLIAADLIDGKISRDYAEREHGAIVDPSTSAIDRAGSERQRRERRPSGGGWPRPT